MRDHDYLTERDYDQTVDTAIKVCEVLQCAFPGAAGYLSAVLQEERIRERKAHKAQIDSILSSLKALKHTNGKISVHDVRDLLDGFEG
jgi:hypothetical protein